MQNEAENFHPHVTVPELIESIVRMWRPEQNLHGASGKPPRLNPRGEWEALCPLHEESTPSFHLDPDKGRFKCFGCDRGGGVLALAKALTGFDNPVEALLEFAERWSVPLPPELEEKIKGRKAGFRPRGPKWDRRHGSDRPTPAKGESVGPTGADAWAGCLPAGDVPGAVAYLAERHLDVPSVREAVRATRGRTGPCIALALRDTAGEVRDVQFRSIEPAAGNAGRFVRVAGAAEGAPLTFGHPTAGRDLLMVEGLTDYLAAIGPMGFPTQAVVGVPGAGMGRAVAMALAKAGKLTGFETVVVAFDADEAGDKGAREVAEALQKAGVCYRRLRPPSKDLAEWCANLLASGQEPGSVLRAAVEAAPVTRPFPWAVPAPDFIRTAPAQPEFLVPKRVPAGSFVVVQGRPNIGKTFLVLHYAALTAAQGKRVLLVEEEGTHVANAQRLRWMGLTDVNLSIAHRQGVRLDKAEWVEELGSFCRVQRISLLLLDPLTELHSGDENDALQMRKVTEAVKVLHRHQPELAIVLLHHTTKGSWSEETSRAEHSRGSGVLVGAADVQLGLSKLTASSMVPRPLVHFRVDVLKAREFEIPLPESFTLTVVDGCAKVLCREMEAPEDERRSETLEELADRAWEILPEHEGSEGMTQDVLRARLGVGSDKVKKAVGLLEKEGRLIRRQRGGLQRGPGVDKAAGGDA